LTEPTPTTSDSFTPEEMANRVAEKFPESVKVLKTGARRLYLTSDRSAILNLCTFLKNDLGFDHASCVSGVDRCDRFQVVYHLTSYESGVAAEIVVDIPRDNPEIDSVTPLWGGANWHEREAYDMFGIVFIGHPRLERILLPSDYEFFPMRKNCEGGRQ